MNRIDRLTSMILMLQSHKVVTADVIAEYFEISVRTVYRDIAALGEAGVPIIAEAGVGYSLMRGYNVPPIMFTELEIAALFMSAEVTEQFGDDSLKESLNGALLKVRAALPDGHKRYLSHLGNRMEVWSCPRGMEAHRSLMPVQEAVVRRHCLRIEYDAGGRGDVTQRTVEALGLIFYGRQWHLIGWCRLRQAMRDFRLDRMRSWQVLEEVFSQHEDFSISEFLKNERKGHLLIPVQLECEAWALERMLYEMPCQITSKKSLEDGRYAIEGQAYCLEWLARWLIGVGDAGIVKGPAELRVMMRGEAEKIARIYEDN